MGLANLANIAYRSQNMKRVNIFDAKTDLSKLIKQLETKEEDVIIIARNGNPVAQLVPYKVNDASNRLGACPELAELIDWETFDELDKEVEEMFEEAMNEDIA